MTSFDVNKFRLQFPLLCGSKPSVNLDSEQRAKQSKVEPVIYFDNGATTQKPHCVINSYQAYYQHYNANVHRASHSLSAKATLAFEQARQNVQKFINAKSEKEIIWTKGATESINLIANTLGKQILNLNDEIIISVSEHHANIVPWQLIAEQTGAIIRVLTLEENGQIDIDAYEALLNDHTKLVCCAHVSNVLGKINPIDAIVKKAKQVGAITVIDGAQAVAHFPIDVQALDCDFYVFSAHKMYGPTGVGVLYGKLPILDTLPPYQAGGEMIKKVSFNQATTFNELPFKLEAGTPNIAGVIAFSQAVAFNNQYHDKSIQQYELQLTQYCYQALANIAQVRFLTPGIPDIPVIAFSIADHHNHDIASALDSYNIAIRSGHHCAMPLMEYFKVNGCLRVSMAPYNTFEEIDYFIASLKTIISGESKPDTKSLAQQVIPTSELNSDDIINQFAKSAGWHNRHREIMLLSKQLPRLGKDLRNDGTLIQGCESLAWLLTVPSKQGKLYFQADSDAKVIRGLLVIVLAAFNGKTAQQIQAFDVESYFAKLGLMQQLSPSRGNGVLAIVEKIKQSAQATL